MDKLQRSGGVARDFKDLTYLLAIAKHQNITKAADALYVGILKAAFPTMRCTYMLPATLPAFQRVYPHVKVDISEECSDNLDQMILDGEVAFYTEPVVNPNQLIEYESLGEEELLVCTEKDHPIGQYAVPNPASPYPELDISLLKDELVIMMLPGQRTRQIMDKYLQDAGIQLNNVIYTSNLPAIMELVSMGYGISFVFDSHLRRRSEARPISCYSFGEPRMVSHFVAAYRKGSYLPVYCRDFIENARQTCGGT